MYNQDTFLKELTSMSAEELNRIIELNGKTKLVKPFDTNTSNSMEVNNNGRIKDNE